MEIKGKVHYVGVNDRTKALFENLWPLPYGVSYNSYLIADDEMVDGGIGGYSGCCILRSLSEENPQHYWRP